MVKNGNDPGKLLLPSQIQNFGKLKQGLNRSLYQARLSDAWDALHLVQSEATTVRQSFLSLRISVEKSKKGSKTHANKMRAILRSEYLARMWPKLRRYAKGHIRCSLSRVEVPVRDEKGEITGWRSISSQDKLFSTLIKRNMVGGNSQRVCGFRLVQSP